MELKDLVTDEFQKGLKEGETGKASAHRNWHFKVEPFSGEENLRDVFTDRLEAVSRVARSLGRSVMGVEEVVACVGPHGAGVSATLRVVHQALEDSGKIRGVLENASTFTDVKTREEDGETFEVPYFEVFLDEIDFTKVRYVILDEADSVAEYVLDYVTQIKKAAGSFKRQPAVVLGLHISGWLAMSSELRDRIAEQVWLPPLGVDDVCNLLRGYLVWAKGKEDIEPFDEETLRRIGEISGGLPSAAVDLARRTLRECSVRGVAHATPSLVDEISKAYGYHVVRLVDEWALSEDETRAVVIEHVVRRSSGVSSTALSDLAGVRRTTVNYHLSVLEAAGVLARQRRGREVYYVPTEPGRSALELLMFRRLHDEASTWVKRAM